MNNKVHSHIRTIECYIDLEEKQDIDSVIEKLLKAKDQGATHIHLSEYLGDYNTFISYTNIIDQ